MFQPAKNAASEDMPARPAQNEPAARGNCSGPAVTAGHLVISAVSCNAVTYLTMDILSALGLSFIKQT